MNWKLNDNLILEEIDKRQIAKELPLYFKENTSPDISPGVLWEVHKAHIRGRLIELDSRKKKEKTHQPLERKHKTNAL